MMSGKRDSNPRHSAWEADALPTELLPRAPCRLSAAYCPVCKKRADNETRTRDPRITNALLYQLSHIGLFVHCLKCSAKLRFFLLLQSIRSGLLCFINCLTVSRRHSAVRLRAFPRIRNLPDAEWR